MDLFAFRGGILRVAPGTNALASNKARIFIFDKAAWCRDFMQLQHATYISPHFSILETLAIENERATPQQAVSSITNVDDIEAYISRAETARNERYLRVVDLDTSERLSTLSELSQMGITAASMFPGLDGTCEELKGRHFGIA